MYFKVGPNEKEFSVHANVLKERLARFCSTLNLPDCVIGFRDDIEDIFGHILQYIYVGDYHIPSSANESAHIACEHGTHIAPERLLLLKDDYFQTRTNTQQLLDNLAEKFPQTPVLPFCGETGNICQNVDVLLMHARLHILIGRKHSMDTLEHLSLWKLVHLLEHMDLDPCRTEGVVNLLLLISELREKADDLYTVMVHYTASRLRFLVR